MDQIFVSILRLVVRFLRSFTGSIKNQNRPHFEIERKYRISQEEFERLPVRLHTEGFVREDRVSMTDTFIPAEHEGETIRLREQISESGKTVTILTIKQWVDVAGGRERQEAESEGIDSTTRECLLALGRRLNSGKGDLLSYSKARTTYSAFKKRYPVIAAFDQVSGLGDYSGHYMEIEVLVNSESEVSRAREFVESFARELLGEEREMAMSYSEMLRRARV